MKKRILSVVLAIMMIATLVPASVFSAFAAETYRYWVTLVMFDGEEEQTLGSLPIEHGEGLGEIAAQLEELVKDEVGDSFYLAYFIEDEQGEVEEIDIYDFVVEEDITIYMAIMPRLYYVKFVDENGTAIGNEEGEVVLHGEKVTAPTAPEKENYTFVGWVDEDGNLVDLETLTVTEDMTLTAKYDIDGYQLIVNKGVLTGYTGTLPADLVIPDGITSIGSYAFSGCTSLVSVTIPDSVTSIEGSAFSGCTSLESVTIPDSVTSIGPFAFRGCTSLSSITIPDSVRSIGSSVFIDCTSLESITIPDGVLFIRGGCVFSGCKSLRSVTIPDSVTTIEERAFSGCTSLESITIPDSVTSIEGSAFSGCTSLESITIPDSVTSIGYDAFSGCDSLKSITIPDSVTSIGSYAFFYCRNLESITIPESVTSISEDAFNGCSKELVIYGIPGSEAEQYANDNGIKFEDMRTFTVTFIDGEETVSEQEVRYEKNVIVPDEPSKEGHTFVGWVDEDGNLVDLEKMAVKENMILTAKYEMNSFTVTFFAGARKPGKTEQIVKKVEVAYGSDPSKLVTKDFVKDFDFNTKKFLRFFFCLFWKPTGRWTDANGNVVTKITSNITLYAEYDWFWKV